MICDKIGIPCVCVFGNYDETNKTAHMWNYVLMEDDCWYAVDLTWDDCDGEDGIDVKYEYFLKGSAMNIRQVLYQEHDLIHIQDRQ